MSRRIRKNRRTIYNSSSIKDIETLKKLVKNALNNKILDFQIPKENQKFFPEEAAFFIAEIPGKIKNTCSYSITMDLEVIFSSRYKEEWLNYKSKQIQEKIRSYKNQHKKLYK